MATRPKAAPRRATAGVFTSPRRAVDVWRWTASFRTRRRTSPPATRIGWTVGRTSTARAASSTSLRRTKWAAIFAATACCDYVGERYLQFAGSSDGFSRAAPTVLRTFWPFTSSTRPSPRTATGRTPSTFAPAIRPGTAAKGRNIIGALNYLADVGVNSVYMLTMNVNGDGKDVWPWTSDAERLRYDVSKLDQWEIVFSHMDRLGIMQHFVLQEQENDQLLDGGELGIERRIYFRELIARFAHHPAITWNLGEENTNTREQRQDFARYFHEHDPYRHPGRHSHVSPPDRSGL